MTQIPSSIESPSRTAPFLYFRARAKGRQIGGGCCDINELGFARSATWIADFSPRDLRENDPPGEAGADTLSLRSDLP